MKVAYFDCFAGVAGDMTLGALIDLGLDPAVIDGTVRGLGVEGFSLEVKRVDRGNLSGTKVDVHMTGKQPARYLRDIEAILDGGPLASEVREAARRVFRKLVEAESRAHRVPVEQVHLHEVGALDAIVDVVGSCAGLHALGVEAVLCSPVVLGHGMARSGHGPIPIPAPATVEVLRGVPVREGPVAAEMTTPTGAALVATLARGFGPLPEMRLLGSGYGAGSRDHLEVPNLLRIMLGEQEGAGTATRGTAVLLEANLDDATPQLLGWVAERLLARGALDVWIAPVLMKKGRPGHVLSLLAARGTEGALADLLFRETTTIGIRERVVERRMLERRLDRVETRFGSVRVKVALEGGEVLNAAAEYDDCARAAVAANVPLKDVQSAALLAWRELSPGTANAASPAAAEPPSTGSPGIAIDPAKG